jgi:hypothetical protein
LTQQIAPQVSEIRKSWIVHGVPLVGGIFLARFCLRGLSSRPRP